MRLWLLVVALLLPLAFGASALRAKSSTFVVNTTSDSDDGICDKASCSLREAINAAMAYGGPARITFAIRAAADPGCDKKSGVCTIRLSGPLPRTVGPIVIDGYTQRGAVPNPSRLGTGMNMVPAGMNMVLKVVIDGELYLSEDNGISPTVRGLVLRGVVVDGPAVIEGNFIGTDATGKAAAPNGSGIRISSTSRVQVIGNLISGNETHGIYADSSQHRIQGNFIGTDITGRFALPNKGDGIHFNTENANNSLIGGRRPHEGNLISGNHGHGIRMDESMGTIIQGNFIGTDVTGTRALANGGNGIMIEGAMPRDNLIGGLERGAGNVISGNAGNGIEIQSRLNTVQGNMIGTDRTGKAPIPNGGHGIFIGFFHGAENTIGGTEANAGNVIAFNSGDGVHIDGVDAERNTIRGNSIHSNRGKGIAIVQALDKTAPPIIVGPTAKRDQLRGAACPGCIIDIYSGNDDEGRMYEGSTAADQKGVWTYSGRISGPKVTATATDGNGSTSEFSAPWSAVNSVLVEKIRSLTLH